MTKPEFIARCRQLFKAPKNVDFKDYYAVVAFKAGVTPVATDGDFMLIFRKTHDHAQGLEFTSLEELQPAKQEQEQEQLEPAGVE